MGFFRDPSQVEPLQITTQEKGRVIRTLGGYYSIHPQGENGEIVAFIRGRLKKEGGRILVGDMVTFRAINEEQFVIEEILPRHSYLKRPQLANVHRVVITFSLHQPKINYHLLDRYLFLVEAAELKVVLCINKLDLGEDTTPSEILTYYRSIGYPTIFCSAETGQGMDELRREITDGVNVFAGPSGVGKSALLNALNPNLQLETGEISRKLKRGRHTTRQSELFILEGDTYVADTPGFSSLKLQDMEREQVQYYFPDFAPFLRQCHFHSCIHDQEPKCAIKEAVEEKKINRNRYQSYLQILSELWERD